MLPAIISKVFGKHVADVVHLNFFYFKINKNKTFLIEQRYCSARYSLSKRFWKKYLANNCRAKTSICLVDIQQFSNILKWPFIQSNILPAIFSNILTTQYIDNVIPALVIDTFCGLSISEGHVRKFLTLKYFFFTCYY